MEWWWGGGVLMVEMEVMVGVVEVVEKKKKNLSLIPSLSHVKYTMLKYITSLKFNRLHSHL